MCDKVSASRYLMEHEDGDVMSVEGTGTADNDESGGGKSTSGSGTPTPRRFLRRGEGELMRMRSLENARRKKEMKRAEERGETPPPTQPATAPAAVDDAVRQTYAARYAAQVQKATTTPTSIKHAFGDSELAEDMETTPLQPASLSASNPSAMKSKERFFLGSHTKSAREEEEELEEFEELERRLLGGMNDVPGMPSLDNGLGIFRGNADEGVPAAKDTSTKTQGEDAFLVAQEVSTLPIGSNGDFDDGDNWDGDDARGAHASSSSSRLMSTTTNGGSSVEQFYASVTAKANSPEKAKAMEMEDVADSGLISSSRDRPLSTSLFSSLFPRASTLTSTIPSTSTSITTGTAARAAAPTPSTTHTVSHRSTRSDVAIEEAPAPAKRKPASSGSTTSSHAGRATAPPRRGNGSSMEEAAVAHTRGVISEVEEELLRLREERHRLSAARAAVEAKEAEYRAKTGEVDGERARAMEEVERNRIEAEKKMVRERKLIERQRADLHRLQNAATKKDRAELEAAREQIAALEEAARTRESRHRLAVERLTAKVTSLQRKVDELRAEVREHERMRNSETAAAKSVRASAPAFKPPTVQALPSTAVPAPATSSAPVPAVKERTQTKRLPSQTTSTSTSAAVPELETGVRRASVEIEDVRVSGGSIVSNASLNHSLELEGGDADEAALWRLAVQDAERAECIDDIAQQHERAGENRVQGEHASGRRPQDPAPKAGAAYDEYSKWHSVSYGGGDGLSGTIGSKTGHAPRRRPRTEESHQNHIGRTSSVSVLSAKNGNFSSTERRPSMNGSADMKSREGLVRVAAPLQQENLGSAVPADLRPSADAPSQSKTQPMLNTWPAPARSQGRATQSKSPRSVVFQNGTRKDTLPDGGIVVYFTNGDVKRTTAAGTVQYFYAEVATWHSTLTDGREVYHFPSGQCESHLKDGTKEILFPDRSFRVILPGGDEEDRSMPRGWIDSIPPIPNPPKNPII